jgi:hypothetical protein
LWHWNPLKSIDVSSAVQAEWSRRNNGEMGALKAQIDFKKPGNNDGRFPPKDDSKYCQNHKAKGHDTKDCSGVSPAYLKRHAFNDNRPQGQDTTSANLVQIAQNLSIEHKDDNDPIGSYIASANVANIDSKSCIVDFSATHHMVNNASLLSNVKSIATRFIVVGNGHKVPTSSTGTLQLGKAVFHDVFIAEGLDRNLSSVGATPADCKWQFDKNSATLVDCNNCNLITAHRHNGLYTIKASGLIFANTAQADLHPLQDWHERLGHVNVRRIMAMARDGRTDGLSQVSASEVNEFECSYCIMGKGKRLPSPRSDIRATKPLAVIHIDLWGSATIVSSGESTSLHAMTTLSARSTSNSSRQSRKHSLQ